MNRQYKGKEITVLYDIKRCIHAAKCVKGAGEVFNPQERLWINADNAAPEKIAAVITRCPTGALHYEIAGDALAEKPDAENTVTTAVNGPLFLRGNINIRTNTGEDYLTDTRVALCRCGASKNKPLCDNSHREIDFKDDGLATPKETLLSDRISGGSLTATPLPNAPLQLRGAFIIKNSAGERIYAGSEIYLCRCGASASKPFCDGSHARVVFTDSQ